MSPTQVLIFAFVIIVASVAVNFYLAMSRRKSEPKRFGLKEAEAAAEYISTVGAAGPVMAVVVGVLGYENWVGPDLAAATISTEDLNDGDDGEIENSNQEIAELKRVVAQLQAQIDTRKTELAEKKRVAALFAA